MDADLKYAFDELDLLPADCVADGIAVPSDDVFSTVRQLLPALYEISPQRFIIDVSEHDSSIAIEARGVDGRAMLLKCESNGEVFCIVLVGENWRRARYSSASMLPDGFIREALLDLR